MELLTIILLVIIVLLTYLLLKKEKVLGIKTETKDNNDQIKVVENKDYRKNIYNLLEELLLKRIFLPLSKIIIPSGI